MIGFQENSRKAINTGYKKIRDFPSVMKSLQLSIWKDKSGDLLFSMSTILLGVVLSHILQHPYFSSKDNILFPITYQPKNQISYFSLIQ